MNKIEQDKNGVIYYEIYSEDGVLLSRTSYAPTTVESDLPADVKSIAKKIWTAKIIADYQAILSRPLFSE